MFWVREWSVMQVMTGRYVLGSALLPIPSSFAGVIASLAPMMALMAGVVFFGLPSRGLHWLGVAIGTGGIAVLRWDGRNLVSAPANLPSGALAAVLLAAACRGLAAQTYRRHLPNINPLHVTAVSVQVMALAVVTLEFGYVDAEPPSWRVALACILIAAAMRAVRQPIKLKS